MPKQPDEHIDLRGTPCPLNWAKTKLHLEKMATGRVLEVLLDDGDAIRNVPSSVKAEGHKVVAITPLDGGFRLIVERA